MKGILKNNTRLSLLISLSYLILWYVLVFASSGGRMSVFLEGAGIFSWQLIFTTAVNFYLHLLAIPFVRKRKIKWIWIILIIVSLLLLLIPGFYWWNRLGSLLSVPHTNNEPLNGDIAVRNFLMQFLGMAYFASIKLLADYLQLKLKNQQLVIEKKASELNYLKSQTNPHFLFNTLNNIYALARDKSDLAPESLLRLSGILRYMLYETQVELVPVAKETDIIRDYIELEKIRYDQSLKVSFVCTGDYEKKEIPPLLMIPLVENAFKHGVSETMNNPFIDISLIIENNRLRFEVINSVDEQGAVSTVKENIGLSNLRRQLELLFSDYELKAEYQGSRFFAGIWINLDSYAKN